MSKRLLNFILFGPNFSDYSGLNFMDDSMNIQGYKGQAFRVLLSVAAFIPLYIHAFVKISDGERNATHALAQETKII